MAADTDASAAAAAAAPPKSRRPHRKSRDGCAECKRRHIRCDKGRPACTNCTIAERACAYPSGARHPVRTESPPAATTTTTSNGASGPGPASDHRPRPPLLVTPNPEEPGTPAASASPAEPRPVYPRLPFHLGAFPETSAARSSSPGAAAAAAVSSSSSTSTPVSQPPSHSHSHPHPPPPPLVPSTFSTKDLVLLHHASTSMPDAILGRGQTTYIIDIALRYAVESPYLIKQLLAFAALHLAHVQHASSAATEALRHQSTDLQTRALTDFKTETDYLTALSSSQQQQGDHQQQQPHQDDAYHGVPRFLFASILGLHVFAETFLSHQHLPPSEFPSFVANFIDCMHLHRGVRTVLKPTWEGLLQTELGPLFSALSHATATRQRGHEVDALAAFIASDRPVMRDVDDAVKETCLEAVRHLSWGFDLQARLTEAEGPHAPSGVSVMFPGPFVELVRQLRPLALVVLAYFGVLVHRSRRFWIFGDSGTFVIRAVASHVGPVWEEPLRWPLAQLEKA